MCTERFIQSTWFVVQKNIFHIIGIDVELNSCFLGLKFESIFFLGRQMIGCYLGIREDIKIQLSVAVIPRTETRISLICSNQRFKVVQNIRDLMDSYPENLVAILCKRHSTSVSYDVLKEWAILMYIDHF
jgi:hypothetical protein